MYVYHVNVLCCQMASHHQQLSSIVSAQSTALHKQQVLIEDYTTRQQAHLTSHADSINKMLIAHNDLTQVI